MKRFQKVLSLTLACVLAASAFAGCSPKTDDSNNYLTDAEGKRVKVESVATIEGKPVTLEEFRLNFLPQMASYELQFGSSTVWTEYPELFSSLKDSVLETIRTSRVLDKYAEEHGLTMTAEEKKAEVDKYITDAKSQNGGDEGFQAALAEMSMTEESFRKMVETQLYTMRVQDEMQKTDGVFAFSDEDAKAKYESDYLHAKHILITMTAESEDAEAITARAQEALTRAKAGEDFDALIQEYGEDPGAVANPEGYYFAEGQMVTEFYNGTKALEINAISDLVQSSYGYHIIQRLPLDSSYFDTNKDNLKAAMGATKVNEEVMALISASVIEKTPEFDLITYENIDPNGPPASSSSSESASAPASSAPESTPASESSAAESTPASSAASH